jgi:NitT/TauT family transport system ATP-binding protein
MADIGIDLPRPVRALQKDPRFHEIYSGLWAKLEEALGHGGLS